MLGSSRALRVYAYPQPADLRKGFDGLSGLVSQGLGADPMCGDLYVFVNRARTLAKVLVWDGTGLCIYAKRLERGRFACVWRDAPAARLSLTVSELALFLEGSMLVGKVALSPPPFTFTTLSGDKVASSIAP